MTIFINPGSGPVPNATKDNALDNIGAFVADLRERGLNVDSTIRRGVLDGDGRYGWVLVFDDDRRVEVEMPGVPLHQVRWMDEVTQNIWNFPRLYIDGSSWVWRFALNACAPDDEDGAP